MVKHIISASASDILTLISSECNIGPSFAQWLLEFGAVYINKKRVRAQVPVQTGDYIRVHLRPRRFQINDIYWKKHILLENADMMILNKPAGIPVHSTVDNAVETVTQQIKQHLGVSVFVTHRLDIATQGLIFLAKSPLSTSKFNKALMAGHVKKTYTALVEGKVTLPHAPYDLIHYMKPDYFQPKVLSDEPIDSWKLCHLQILSVKHLNEVSLCKIKLVTGRTHQIRAQMAKIGHPVLGDVLYGSNCPLPRPDSIKLMATNLRFLFNNQHYDFSLNSDHLLL